ncbi:MAG: hypothetical protein ACK4WF_07115 [Candidatus Brocadiales bacterium]
MRTDFSMSNSREADNRIRTSITNCIESHVFNGAGEDFASFILTGSMSRGEGVATIGGDGRVKLYSDMDMLLVANGNGDINRKLMKAKEIESYLRKQLSLEHIEGNAEVNVISRSCLGRFKENIFGCELKGHGKVLWGEPSILEEIPPLYSNKIPRQDAFALLNNRILEQLTSLEDVLHHGDASRNLYNISKLYLDIITSLLVFLGEYNSTYAARAQNFKNGYKRFDNTPLAGCMKDLIEKVEYWTRWRAHPVTNGTLERSLLEQWLELMSYTREIWLWELSNLLRRETSKDGLALINTYIAEEPFPDKVKGWLRLLKRCYMLKKYPPYGRTARLLTKGSPRALTYSCGALLYFTAPAMLNGEWTNGYNKKVLDFVYSMTPVFFLQPNPTDWDKLRKNLTINYESFFKN